MEGSQFWWSRKFLMGCGSGKEGICFRRLFPMALRILMRHRWVSLRGLPGGKGNGNGNRKRTYSYLSETTSAILDIILQPKGKSNAATDNTVQFILILPLNELRVLSQLRRSKTRGWEQIEFDMFCLATGAETSLLKWTIWSRTLMFPRASV